MKTLPIRLTPGQDLRPALEAVVREHGCQAAFVIAGQIFCAAAAVLALLYASAARLGFDLELHKLRVDARALRNQYEERVALIRSLGGDFGSRATKQGDQARPH